MQQEMEPPPLQGEPELGLCPGDADSEGLAAGASALGCRPLCTWLQAPLVAKAGGLRFVFC